VKAEKVQTRPHLSVILPAYNERENLAKVVETAVAVVERLVSTFEVLVVDDGSNDGTDYVGRALVDRHAGRVRLLRHPRNLGYGAALRTGFARARGELIFYTDADNQFDIAELEHFLPLVDEYDVVVGFRVYRYDPVLRSMLSWIYNRLVRILFRVRVRDVDCAFKLFRREVLEKITIETDDFFVDTELVAKARRWNFRLLEKGVRHYPRLAGVTTVHASHIPETLRRVAVMFKGVHFPGQRRIAAVAERQCLLDAAVQEYSGTHTTADP
jgi:glycosyltransferase involved in cell wall biosynthesis